MAEKGDQSTGLLEAVTEAEGKWGFRWHGVITKKEVKKRSINWKVQIMGRGESNVSCLKLVIFNSVS